MEKRAFAFWGNEKVLRRVSRGTVWSGVCRDLPDLRVRSSREARAGHNRDHFSSFWWLLVEEYSYIRPRLGGDFLWSMNPQGSCRFTVQSLGASPCRLEPGGRAGPLSAPLPVFERLPSWTWLVSEENFNGDAGHRKSLLGVKVQRLDWSSPGREAESGVRA